ncbi:MAG: 3-deoxy-manno-octulosonate cytidylyltransferase [Planctomycetota bacterium]
MPVLALIPARYASTRFPGKPLVAETGKPLIQHVVERVGECATIGRVVVATDDERIRDAVVGFGGEAVMTRADHPNGTSRLAEAVEVLERDAGAGGEGGTGSLPGAFSLVVNVQGDEPEVPPATIDALVEGLAGDDTADMATLASPFDSEEDPNNPNVVKLVLDRRGRAMYFSRSPIPHDRDAELLGTKPHVAMFKHPGLYAYRRDFLLKYPTLEPTPLEEAEKLEQLRVLEHGYAIKVVHADAPHPGIDTPEQYAAFVERFRGGH